MGLGKNVTRAGPGPTENRSINSFGGFSVQDQLLMTPGAGAPYEVSGNSYISVYRGIMSIPSVWRAANLMADLLGSVPWDAYTSHGRDQLEIIQPTPTLLDQPAPPDTQMTTFSGMALDLVLDGNAVARIAERDNRGYPTAISPHPAAWTGIRRDDYTKQPYYIMSGEEVDAHDVLHIKGPTVPGQIRGMGVLEAHFWSTLRLAHDLNKQARDVSLNAVPTGVFQSGDPDLTSTAATATKASWQQSMAHRTIAVIGPNDKFTPLSWNPEQAQLIQARQFSLLEVALLFGLPGSFLGASSGGSMTYSNVENDAIQLLKFSMRGHLTRMEQSFSLCFPRGTVSKADLDSFLQSDTLTRYQSYQLGIESGWLRRSEVRVKERLVAVPGIDDAPQTAKVQLQLNKTNPVTSPAITQPHDPGGLGLVPEPGNPAGNA